MDFQVVVDSGQQQLPSAASGPPSWLSVTPTSGTAPAGLLVTVNQGTMPAAAYSAGIRVLDPTGIPTDVPVTLTVVNAPPPQLSVSPSFLHFVVRSATPGTLVQDLLGQQYRRWCTVGFSASMVGGSSWISFLPGSCQTALNTLILVRVSVNTQGLSPGSHRDVIEVASPNGVVDVPVVVFISGNGSILGVDTTGVLFPVIQRNSSTSTRNI